jgi:uncharacterized protein (DUF885 family)
MASITRRSALALLGATALGSVSTADAAGAAAPGSPDDQFSKLSARWLEGALRLNPVNATYVGDHRFDREIDDMSALGRKARADHARQILSAIEAMPRAQMSPANQVDAAILANQLRFDLWDDTTLQSWAWDPLVYNNLAGNALYNTMAREFASLPERMSSVISRMEKLPELYRQTRANLDPARVPRVHAETVAKQNAGVRSIVDDMIAPHAGAIGPKDRARLQNAIAGVHAAVGEHQKWIDDTLVPNAKGDFRLGSQLYDQKLALALNSPLTRQEIRVRAEAEVKRIRAEMYDLARGVLAGKKGAPRTPARPSDAQQQKAIEAALELVYAERPARDAVVAACEAALATASDFVRAKDLITLPDAPVKIILMPEFQRGVAVAYCDPPGPLDKGQSTLFAVSPIPDDWSEAQASSFLREYNSRGIHELTIHEAMPGHYVQLWHANRYPSILRAVLYSGPFVEGWACYAEDMMAAQG